ncbi:MAG: hypothetical protein Q4F17_00680 [Eubacteriales bacterium]|nr:hypothetical protein [Eubacteriales bacterium]
MGFFYETQEPHIPEEQGQRPRKTGFARLMELWSRDGKQYFLAGLLAFLGLIPYIAGVSFSIMGHTVLPVLLSGIFGGMAAAPQICGAADTILRSMRDEAGWWWLTYQRAWKRNAGASLVPGAVFGLISAVWLFALYHVAEPGAFLMLAAAALVLLGLAGTVLPMLVLMELPFWGLVKNAVLLLLGHLPKILLAALVQLAYFGVILWWFPASLLIFLAGSVWVPLSVSLLLVYPILDSHFGIEAAIGDIRRQEQAHLRESIGK